MRSILIIIALALQLLPPTGLRIAGDNPMTWTPVQSNTSAASTIALTGIGAGNLIMLQIRWSSSVNTGLTSVSDGTSTLSLGTHCVQDLGGSNYAHTQFAYLLSANSGNKTFTITYTGTGSTLRNEIYEFSHTGAIDFDTQNIGSGTGTTATSGTITTTGTSELVFSSGGDDAQAYSNPKIGGAAVDGSVAYNTYNYLGYKIYSATQTDIAASHTVASSSRWMCNIIAFKEAASGPSIPVLMATQRRFRVNAGSMRSKVDEYLESMRRKFRLLGMPIPAIYQEGFAR